jgi:hypothetical protein
MRKRTNSRWIRRVVPLLLVAIAFGAGAWAFTASNTFGAGAGGAAGAGSTTISGYAVGTPTYTTLASDASKISSFSFSLNSVTDSTVVKASLDGTNYVGCTDQTGTGNTTRTYKCSYASGSEADVQSADNITVIATN